LFVFPDLWSINCFTEKIKWKYDILNVSSTSLNRYKFFLDVKTGKKKNIITTQAGVFQDWKNLNSIFLFEPYKWYYKNQQNPRYHLQDLVKQIKFFYGVEKLYFVM
jgi:primosomal protein N'